MTEQKQYTEEQLLASHKRMMELFPPIKSPSMHERIKALLIKDITETPNARTLTCATATNAETLG